MNFLISIEPSSSDPGDELPMDGYERAGEAHEGMFQEDGF
jgi:hypothetical protein